MTQDKTVYSTYSDKARRTNVSVLIKNHPVISEIRKTICPPHNGFVTANVDVVYTLNNVPVLTKCCQIKMPPDKSEASIQTNEEFFAAADLGRHNFKIITITREQFDVLAELFGEKK